MYLITGGFAQGKLDFVLKHFNYTLNDVTDNLENIGDKQVINHFEKIIECMYNEGKSLNFVDNNLELLQNKVIITMEVGSGIVPIDKRERELREFIGRTNCILAKNSKEVYRVICGIGERIK